MRAFSAACAFRRVNVALPMSAYVMYAPCVQGASCVGGENTEMHEFADCFLTFGRIQASLRAHHQTRIASSIFSERREKKVGD